MKADGSTALYISYTYVYVFCTNQALRVVAVWNANSRGLGRRIHGSVEDTKLSTNKQHSLSNDDSGVQP